MSPILGIIASSKLAAAGDFESIATTTVGSGGVTEVNFTSIPSTYTHLQLRMTWSENSTNWLAINFNGDTTGSNYKTHELQGNGSSVSAGTPTFTYGIGVSLSNTTNGNNAAIVDILDYANTNKNKTLRSLSGQDTNGAGIIQLLSGLWASTSAISSFTLYAVNGFTIAQYSHFALYGIKSA